MTRKELMDLDKILLRKEDLEKGIDVCNNTLRSSSRSLTVSTYSGHSISLDRILTTEETNEVLHMIVDYLTKKKVEQDAIVDSYIISKKL